MGNNVISLFDVRRERAASQDDDVYKSELSVQLDLPFDIERAALNMPTCTVTDTAAAQPFVYEELDRPAPTASKSSHADKYLFLAYAEAFTFPDDFLNFCKAMSPDLVVDLRVAPRLDFVRPVRKQAFELFEMCGIEYRDMLGRFNASSYDLPQSRFEELLGAVISLHTSHDEGRPTLALFDDLTFAQFCTTKLAQSVAVMSLDTEAIRRMVTEGARARM